LRRLIREAELPVPAFNVEVKNFLVDAHWPAHKLVLEVDGRRFHGHAAAFENDRRRDQILVAGGYRVIRVTWRQLTREPMQVAVRLAQALAWAEAA
jgi:very-short-patch-repair endonuclease